MPAVSRLTDIWVGICCCHPPFPCIPMSGTIITGSSDCVSAGLGGARVGDITIGGCGHTGIIVSGSSGNLTNGVGKATVGSIVTGCNIGIIVTGSPTHTTG